MTILASLLKELEREAITTRRMLACVPNDKYDWQPHPKSMTISRLTTHIAELPEWITMALTSDELDFEKNPYKHDMAKSTEDALAFFEKCLESGKASLKAADEKTLDEPWTLRSGEQIFDVSPKGEVIRMTYCQMVHHRAQLGVFLRLLDIPIPGSYGPSADDTSM